MKYTIVFFSLFCFNCLTYGQISSEKSKVTCTPYVLGDMRFSFQNVDSTDRLQTSGAASIGSLEYALMGINAMYLLDSSTVLRMKVGAQLGNFSDLNYEGQPLQHIGDLSLDVQHNDWYFHSGIDNTSNLGPNASPNWLNNIAYYDRSGDGYYYRAVQTMGGYRNVEKGTTYAAVLYWDQANRFSAGYLIEQNLGKFFSANQSTQFTSTYAVSTTNVFWEKKSQELTFSFNTYSTWNTNASWWYSVSVEYAYTTTNRKFTFGVRPQYLTGRQWFVNPEGEKTSTFVLDGTIVYHMSPYFKSFIAGRIEQGQLVQNQYQIASVGILFALNE